MPEPWGAFAFPGENLKRADGTAEQFNLSYEAPGTGASPQAAAAHTKTIGGALRDAITAQGYKAVCEDEPTSGGLPSFVATFEKSGASLALEVMYHRDQTNGAADGSLGVHGDTRASALQRASLGRCRKAI